MSDNNKNNLGVVIRTTVYLIVALVIALLALAFALLNGKPVQVNLFYVLVEGSLAVWIIGSFLAGVLFMALVTAPGRLRRGFQTRRQRKELEKAQQKLEKLQPSPARSQPKSEVKPAPVPDDSDSTRILPDT